MYSSNWSAFLLIVEERPEVYTVMKIQVILRVMALCSDVGY
jgi:hypothetical protein